MLCLAPLLAGGLLGADMYAQEFEFASMLIVEDGTKVPDANTLIDAAMVADHALLVGNLAWAVSTNSLREQAIFRAMRWFSSLEARMKGSRTYVDQELAFPRYGVFAYGREILSNQIPKELKQALMEAAMLELSTPDALQPTQASGQIKAERKWLDGVGGRDVEYFAPPAIGAISRPKVMQLILPFLNGVGTWAAH